MRLLCPPLTVFVIVSPNRTENADTNLPESQEFLSGVEEKKTTRFTDVSSNGFIRIIGKACKCLKLIHAYSGPLSLVGCSLKEKPHSGCLSSTWAMQSWVVES